MHTPHRTATYAVVTESERQRAPAALSWGGGGLPRPRAPYLAESASHRTRTPRREIAPPLGFFYFFREW